MTDPNSNPLAVELRARMRAAPDEATGLWIARDEIEAVAAVLTNQHKHLVRLTDGLRLADELTKADEVMAHRMIAIIKIARHFTMRALMIPGADHARDWLQTYIDGNGWGPLPWPDSQEVGAALLSLGYLNIGGNVERSAAVAPVITKEKENG